MAKVRDINDQPSKSCWKTVASWAIWKKMQVGVGIVLALTLIITLPIVLTGNETSIMPDGNITTTTSSTELLTTSPSGGSTTTRAQTTTTDDIKTSTHTSTSTSSITATSTTTTTSSYNATTTTKTTTGTTSAVTTTPQWPPTPPPGITGWGEWFEWSGCTWTCGKGQRSRIRLCSDGNGGIGDDSDCPGNSHRVEECTNEKCLTGLKLTTDISQNLRKNIFLQDNLFLDRYAQSVTLNGEIIDADGAGVPGYGIWRLNRADYEKVLNGKRRRFTKTEKSSRINSDFFQNVLLGCDEIDRFNESTPIDEILDIVTFEPCISAMALVTLLFIEGNYPVSIEFDTQESTCPQCATMSPMCNTFLGSLGVAHWVQPVYSI